MVYLSFLWHCPPSVFLENESAQTIATARKIIKEMNDEARRQDAKQSR